MRTKQQNEHLSSNVQSMKSYPSSNTIVNEQSTILTTIQTTVSNQQTTFAPSSHQSTTVVTTEDGLITTMESQEYIQALSNNPNTSVVDSTSTLSNNEVFPFLLFH
jgi:hypothetical protein